MTASQRNWRNPSVRQFLRRRAPAVLTFRGPGRELARAYHAQHGRWPADKAAVLTLLAGRPRWQCAGNDLDYDAATGTISLAINAAERC